MSSFFSPLLESASGKPTFLGYIFLQTGTFWDWLVYFQFWVFMFTILICGTVLFYLKLRARHKNIRKLWIFILFFLTKRQMLIPLVWTFAKREDVFEAEALEELLQIRQDCRNASLKHNPTARLKLERRLSQILYSYFLKLEEEGKLKAESRFSKIVQDLEFIDGKLVELQGLYNLEANRWNRATSFFVLHGILASFGMKHFELFKVE